METIGKKEKTQIIFATIVYALMFLLCCIFLALKGIDNLEPVYLINVSSDIFGMAAGFVLYLSCLIDVQRTNTDQRYFIYLLSVGYWGLFTDACSWMVDGIPELIILNRLDNFMYFVCTPLGAFCFWQYVTTWLHLDWKRIHRYNTILHCILFASLAVRVLNLFTDVYFTIDASGYYHRLPIYPVSMLYPMGVMIFTLLICIIERKDLGAFKLSILVIYVVAPVAVGSISVLLYGFSISYVVIMIVLLLMYCVLNISQGREKAIADRDLTVASTIQTSVLPRVFPPFPGKTEFGLYASMNPAKNVGGDFYDFFLIDDDHLGLVMADVSGKGVPAALFMMISKALIKSRLLAGDPPEEALRRVSDQLSEGNTMMMFVTVWASVLEISTGKGTVVNAGHTHPAICRAGGNYELVVYRHSPALGIRKGIKFRSHEYELAPGDSLFVYTDGVPEAADVKGEMFTPERMLETLDAADRSDATATVHAVEEAIERFSAGAEQFDDITMLSLVYKGNNGDK